VAGGLPVPAGTPFFKIKLIISGRSNIKKFKFFYELKDYKIERAKLVKR
jgi:hypothetical protein